MIKNYENKIVMAKMAILCEVKDLLQKRQSMVILPFLEHYFVFFNKDTNKYQFVFLFDKKVGRKKRSRISIFIKIAIWKLMDSAKRQRNIMDMYPKLNILKMTITNINKEINFYKLFKEQLKKDWKNNCSNTIFVCWRWWFF
ncbi:hypothetical protein SKUN_00893 [Spiroplasma kunkelii CR2-3x]|uniref:Uncharacterized protein n=1 Tax=Spiroplasma kunkelii CR2-3x TaxID=273035 RepID=A0A0K2JH95_SPIKU|nr:hypothetical protein [Spiroplasma kunkelii]ALA97782.1 hypothetical protein SKUN_00893 [Spiroplasma kunkelii CR2-3x]